MAGGEVEEAEKVTELRGRVSDLKKPEAFDDDEDWYYRRWLVARGWNVDKAEAMLRKAMEFRQKHDCDNLLQTYKPPEVLERHYVGGVCGYDKEGSPIWVDPFTRLDFKGLLHSVTKEQVVVHKVRSCEFLLYLLKQQTAKLGRPVRQVNVLFDISDLGWNHLWTPGIDCLKAVAGVFEDNYPELLKRTYIINAPKLFVMAYNMIKNVVSPRTREKVQVLGAHWKEVLLKDIDADQLPVIYGGTQVDENGDPRCSAKVLYGGEIPKSYYFTNNDISVDMTSVIIPRRSSKSVEVEISVKRCQLKYCILSEKGDIGYGFMYKPLTCTDNKPSTEVEVLKKVERVNAHMVQQQGVIHCERPGTYVLLLDNSFSWTKSKTVKYSVEVIAESEDSTSLADSALSSDDEDLQRALTDTN